MTLLALPAAGADEEEREPSLRGPLIAGFTTIGVFLGGFLLWSTVASLDSAAIAPGVIIVDSHRKTVQHLEGGILREILVREGESVKAGQVLVRLDTAQAGATVTQLRNQHFGYMARIARLRAEQANAKDIVLPAELRAEMRDPAVAEQVATQQQLFVARRQAYDSQVSVIGRRVQQSREEITALKSQQTAATQRLQYYEEELEGIRDLFAKGYASKPRLMDLQRNVAELRGRIGELDANMARARQAIAAAEFEAATLKSQRQSEINKELQETQTSDTDASDRLRGADDVLKRKDVVAPQDGQVVDMKFFTPGGVIAPGAPILDIVPDNDDMVVEARVNPTDIDSVRVGLQAEVRLSAYRQRIVPMIDGAVTYVSADKLIDPRTGESYFLARAQIKKESLASVEKVALYPGMPAEVFIITGKRRAIEYFLSPILDTVRRAFREE